MVETRPTYGPNGSWSTVAHQRYFVGPARCREAALRGECPVLDEDFVRALDEQESLAARAARAKGYDPRVAHRPFAISRIEDGDSDDATVSSLAKSAG